MLSGIESYQPSDEEPFMNEQQLEYFRKKLLDWRNQLLRESDDTIKHLKENTKPETDIVDVASNELERRMELLAQDRQRKLFSKINEALRRIDEGSYGYCEETGDPINLRRLEARPIATLSIEAQEHHEFKERMKK